MEIEPMHWNAIGVIWYEVNQKVIRICSLNMSFQCQPAYKMQPMSLGSRQIKTCLLSENTQNLDFLLKKTQPQ